MPQILMTIKQILDIDPEDYDYLENPTPENILQDLQKGEEEGDYSPIDYLDDYYTTFELIP